jgi:hypothetical protein
MVALVAQTHLKAWVTSEVMMSTRCLVFAVRKCRFSSIRQATKTLGTIPGALVAALSAGTSEVWVSVMLWGPFVPSAALCSLGGLGGTGSWWLSLTGPHWGGSCCCCCYSWKALYGGGRAGGWFTTFP